MEEDLTKREQAIWLIQENRNLRVEDKLTLQEIADRCGLTLMQVCNIYASM